MFSGTSLSFKAALLGLVAAVGIGAWLYQEGRVQILSLELAGAREHSEGLAARNAELVHENATLAESVEAQNFAITELERTAHQAAAAAARAADRELSRAAVAFEAIDVAGAGPAEMNAWFDSHLP